MGVRDGSALVSLRAQIARIEGRSQRARSVLPFGLRALDARLPGGGLALGALHEVAGGGNGAIDGAAAALFAAGIAARTQGKVLWCITRGRPVRAGPGAGRPAARPGDLCRGRRREDRARLLRGRAAPWRARRRGRRGRPAVDDGLAPAAARGRRFRHHRHRHPPLAAADRGRRFRPADRGHDPLARLGAAVRAACRCPASAGPAGWSN